MSLKGRYHHRGPGLRMSLLGSAALAVERLRSRMSRRRVDETKGGPC